MHFQNMAKFSLLHLVIRKKYKLILKFLDLILFGFICVKGLFPEFKKCFLVIAFFHIKLCYLLKMDNYGDAYFWLLERIYKIVEQRKKSNVSFFLPEDPVFGSCYYISLKKKILRR
jgi:hypothetical protein